MRIRLLTIREVAEVLSINEDRAYSLARKGVIPVVRMGRQIRVPEAGLLAWIDAGGQALPGGWRRSIR